MTDKIKKLNQDFEVSSVCREDLKEFLTEKEALAFTDDEMRRLANKMGDAFSDCGYWDILESCIEYIKN